MDCEKLDGCINGLLGGWGCEDKCVDGWVMDGCVVDGCTDVSMGGWQTRISREKTGVKSRR